MGGEIACSQSLHESESWTKMVVIFKALRGIVKFV